MALSPRALLVEERGRPGPLIRARRARRQLLAFPLATILELCFMLMLCYYSQHYSHIIIASLALAEDGGHEVMSLVCLTTFQGKDS